MNKSRIEKFFYYLLVILMAFLPLVIFVYAPREKVMGDVQRIFYLHVSSAWVGFFAFFVVFVSGIFYLRRRQPEWHFIARASAEIGVFFTTYVLGSGMLWARAAWRTWWVWDARLTTTLIMWFIYLGYLFLHLVTRDKSENQQKLTAIYGIIAFINVPLVFMSIRWWRTMHPVVIDMEGGGLSPRMVQVLIYSLVTLTFLYFYLLFYRRNQLKIERKISELREQIKTRV